ncbi:MAG: serine/threonine-protein kinase, partial [Solirubrobacteraceae bacterium]
IIHRDIKPSNVMVIARAGRLMPKLLDFGIAKRVEGSDGEDTWLEVAPALAAASPAGADHTLTHDGQVLGSPAYMAPEQWRDAATAGPLADQYSLALLAYEALTGHHAFIGPSIEELAEQHLTAPLPALPEHLPATLDAVLARASDKAPERRFASLGELTAAVQLAAREAPGCSAWSQHDEPVPAAADDAMPYPGLAPYTAAEHALFVGRERDIEDALDQLGRHPIVTVVGPSGSGKTSFLAAGLAPSLEPSWQAELLRPGSDPLGALAAIAERQDGPPYREGSRSDGAMPPAAIARAVVGIAQARGGTLLVLVDQAEELFTMCADEAQRAGFAEALVLASASGCVRVVLALRDDFLWRIEQLPTWRGRLGRAIHVLGPPQRDDLERMLTVPARRRGFRFDDADLPREIV